MRTRAIFIIEHPTRGVLREIDMDVARFAWAGRRGDPDTCLVFFSVEEAERTLKRVPLKARKGCDIRSSANSWAVVKPAEGK